MPVSTLTAWGVGGRARPRALASGGTQLRAVSSPHAQLREEGVLQFCAGPHSILHTPCLGPVRIHPARKDQGPVRKAGEACFESLQLLPFQDALSVP